MTSNDAIPVPQQLLFGHSSPQMTQHYARAYESEQAVEAHAALSPVGQIASTRALPPEGQTGAAFAANGRSAERRAPDLLSSPNGVSHVLRSEAAGASPDAPPVRKEERMTTTKSAIKAGQTLVGKYKGEEHTCEVVEYEERLYFVLPKGEVFRSPSAAGKAVTGTATNGYRFWSVPEKAPGGQQARQKAARDLVAATTADAAPSTTGKADSGNGAARSTKLIERAKSQKDIPEGQVRYFCSSCMQAFIAEDAGRGKVPERCPQGHPALDAG